MTADEKQDYPKASNALVFGGILTYIAGILLVMAFASPYWLESYEETFSSFKHMGLWEYCFEEFRYPYYQFNVVFDGCHYIFSEKYYVLREWLLPGWLMVVQAFVTLALMLSFSSQIVIALELIRWPLDFVLLYEWMLSGVACVGNALAALLLFLAVAIYGGECWRRDWLLYPNFNHLSWSYAFAVIAMFLHAFAAVQVYLDARKCWEYRKQKRNLVFQMHPDPGRNGYV